MTCPWSLKGSIQKERERRLTVPVSWCWTKKIVGRTPSVQVNGGTICDAQGLKEEKKSGLDDTLAQDFSSLLPSEKWNDLDFNCDIII
ncbi:hypothetical protein TNCV_1258671 [Trichonephila clavipes]|nr:hypothetical protein TNCV_1258671 [Trichonephila clavipes]